MTESEGFQAKMHDFLPPLSCVLPYVLLAERIGFSLHRSQKSQSACRARPPSPSELEQLSSNLHYT
jgi:hypothetical protein